MKFRDALILVQAALMIPVVEVLLRKKGVRVCSIILNKLSLRRNLEPPSSKDFVTANRTAELVKEANSKLSIYPADCVTRSLVLQHFLRRQGIESELRLGVRTITGQFEAHAWIEFLGVPLAEDYAVQDIYVYLDWNMGK